MVKPHYIPHSVYTDRHGCTVPNWISQTRILLSNDVEMNPGPRLRNSPSPCMSVCDEGRSENNKCPRNWRSNGRFCAAYGCKNKAKDGFRLFKFPTQAELRQTWIQFTRRADLITGDKIKNLFLCESHFKPSDLTDSKRFLRPGTVPTY